MNALRNQKLKCELLFFLQKGQPQPLHQNNAYGLLYLFILEVSSHLRHGSHSVATSINQQNKVVVAKN